MADLPEVTVTGQPPLFGDPFAMDSFGLTDYLGGLSLNEYAQKSEAAAVAVPLAPELLPEFVVTGAKAVTSQLTPLGIALSFFTPTPVASQDQENILLDQMNAWREFLNPTDAGTPPLPQSPALPISTPLPEVVALPTVTVSPPARQTPPRTSFPIVPLLPTLIDFSPTELDAPLPEVVIPVDAPPAPPDRIAAPSLPGEVPIGLPRPGVITLPRDIPWWEAVPAVATPSMTPEPGPSFVPFLPGVSDVSGTIPGIDVLPDVGLRPGLDTPADSTRGGTRTVDTVPPIADFPALLDPAVAVPTPSTVRPVELVPFLDFGASVSPTTGLPLPFASPFADAGTRNPTRIGDRTTVDTCECEKKPKKRKKPTLRTVCYRGTYKQNTRGITFTPKEEVPCESKKSVSKRETDPFGRPVPKRRGKRTTPTWQDTINDVFFPKP